MPTERRPEPLDFLARRGMISTETDSQQGETMKIWNRISQHIYFVGALVALTIAHLYGSIFPAVIGALCAYVAGVAHGAGEVICVECGTDQKETDDDTDPDEIPGRKTGLPSFEELKNAMKPRQNSEHKPGNHKPIDTEIPRSRHGVNYAVQADGTVETPYTGPWGKCGRPSAQCSITTCGCVDYRLA